MRTTVHDRQFSPPDAAQPYRLVTRKAALSGRWLVDVYRPIPNFRKVGTHSARKLARDWGRMAQKDFEAKYGFYWVPPGWIKEMKKWYFF